MRSYLLRALCSKIYSRHEMGVAEKRLLNKVLETLRRSTRDLEVYEVEGLSDQQRKELLNEPHSWIVVGTSKWS